MRRITRFGIFLLVVLMTSVLFAEAQTTGSSLRGYVKDNQGGVLPGVTVTATSPEMITPSTGVTDETGYYRLINLPPGDVHRHRRADRVLDLQARGDSAARGRQLPGRHHDVARHAQRDHHGHGRIADARGQQARQRAQHRRRVPEADAARGPAELDATSSSRRRASISRPFDDGSGRSVYFGHATEHFAHVVQLEGMQAGNYNDFQLTYVQMGSDMIQDTQVKTGGVRRRPRRWAPGWRLT